MTRQRLLLLLLLLLLLPPPPPPPPEPKPLLLHLMTKQKLLPLLLPSPLTSSSLKLPERSRGTTQQAQQRLQPLLLQLMRQRLLLLLLLPPPLLRLPMVLKFNQSVVGLHWDLRVLGLKGRQDQGLENEK
jgi:hypothetical protein